MTARPDTCSSRSRPRSVNISNLLCPTPSRPDGREGWVFWAPLTEPQPAPTSIVQPDGHCPTVAQKKRSVVNRVVDTGVPTGLEPVRSHGDAPNKSADHATIRITGVDSSPHLPGECVRTTMRSGSVRCRCKAPQFSCDRCSFPPPRARSRPEEETTQAVVRAQNGETLVTNHHRLAPLVPEGRSKHSLLVVGKQPNT